ncbi:VOC family protein [Methylophilaceae bacterium]|jgi:catechol-2,3-dioxygenase|nr:VOC family protein [Methylophilaceae bacterium]|tara:strand:+ start:3755 stop:4138 length:384 start_codon:yes stop_codon:yes gene_type:complete
MISGLNHFNLRSEAKMMEILKNFYIEIVGLKLGVRPPFQSNGYWLNVDGKDILHLSETKKNDKNAANVKNTFDHIAFTADDKDTYIKILRKKNIEFNLREVPEIGTEQIFFKDPAGNGIELIFCQTK